MCMCVCVCVRERECVCVCERERESVCVLAYLSKRGPWCRYTLTNRGPESQVGTFFRSPDDHALNQAKIK